VRRIVACVAVSLRPSARQHCPNHRVFRINGAQALHSSAEFQRWSVMGRWKQPERGPPDADLVEWCDLHEDLVVDGRW